MNMATECGRYDLVVTDIKDGLLADAEDRITEVLCTPLPFATV